MIKYFKKFLSPCYSGLAFNKFMRKNYKAAIPLFKKALDFDPELKRREVIYSCLGRCYFYLGEFDLAHNVMNKAYHYYRERKRIDESFERGEYKEFLKAYSSVLRHYNKSDQADQVDMVAEQIE